MSDRAPCAGDLGERGPRRDEVMSIAAQVANLSTGDRSALRRAYLAHTPATEGIVVGLLHRSGVPEVAWQDETAFQRWLLFAHVAAVLSGTAGSVPHGPGNPFGRALFNARYSENRLMRLTAARGTALFDQIVRAARYLAQGGVVPVNLHTIRDLISGDRNRAEAARLLIARDYYTAQHASAGEPQ